MTLYQEKYRIEPARLRGWDYRSPGWYFVTICTHSRTPMFGEVVGREVRLTRVGRIADSELQALHTHYENVNVDEYVVMPNHVHVIVMIDGDHLFSPDPKMVIPVQNTDSASMSPRAGSLSAIIRSYKAGVTRRCRELRLTQLIWQTRFYDQLLRGDQVISAVREYIRNNPANWQMDKENRP